MTIKKIIKITSPSKKCDICLDDKLLTEFVEKPEDLDEGFKVCKCSLSICVDCCLQVDDSGLCENMECNEFHMPCPQCKLDRSWYVMCDERVYNNARRMGLLLKKNRKQLEECDFSYKFFKNQNIEMREDVNKMEIKFNHMTECYEEETKNQKDAQQKYLHLQTLNVKLMDRLKTFTEKGSTLRKTLKRLGIIGA